ncbi:MAG: Sel1 repeat-containing protein [Amphiamblys sp. WSBS2006]|nr:MAG: Sel1 repeat-containing protein [Amphiamblys sp. WSBS2006]
MYVFASIGNGLNICFSACVFLVISLFDQKAKKTCHGETRLFGAEGKSRVHPRRYCDHVYAVSLAGLERDRRRMRGIHRAGELGSGDALSFIGLSYVHGKNGKSVDFGKARHYFERAGEDGSAAGRLFVFLIDKNRLDGETRVPDTGMLERGNTATECMVRAYTERDNGSRSLEIYKEVIAKRSIQNKVENTVFTCRWEKVDDRKGPAYTKEVEEYYRYNEAADNGNILSKIGGLYFYGADGCERDLSKAYFYLKRAADKGSSSAMLYIGHMYQVGEFVGRDNEKAIHFFTGSYEGKSAEAASMLGMIYTIAESTQKDFSKGVKLLKQATISGCRIGKYVYGMLLVRIADKSSFSISNKLLEDYRADGKRQIIESSQLEFPLAMEEHLGYLQGDLKEELRVARRLLEICHVEDIMKEGFRFYRKRDMHSAFVSYLLCSEMGHSGAQVNAALLVDRADVPHKSEIRKRLLLSASMQDNADATSLLGDSAWKDGDIKKAFEHYAKNKKDPRSMFYCGMLCFTGEGVEKDLGRAAAFFYASCELDNNARYCYAVLRGVLAARRVVSVCVSFAAPFVSFLAWCFYRKITDVFVSVCTGLFQ